MANWVSGSVTRVEHCTDSLFSLHLSAPIKPFVAGQFTKLALEIGGERITRAYSYVNAPGNPDLEFYLVNVPGGKLSPSLAQLQAGDEVFIVQDAAGFFVLEEVPTAETLWMFATGTAIGPFLSILQHQDDLARFNNIVLVHAVRYRQDLSYWTLMQTLENQFGGKLRIQAIVSRETTPDALFGRIPALIANGELERCVGLTLDAGHNHVMLCGNPDMVHDTQHILSSQRNMTKHLRQKPGHITSEQYW